MKKTILVISMAFVALTTVNAMASSCPGGYTETDVSGTVSTINVGPNQEGQQQQLGTIEMRLTSTNKRGKILFDESGTVFGTETERTETGSILSHVIRFDDGSTIETMGDEATILYPTSACPSFVVEEVISNFWGTQAFKRATGEIWAEGSISFPSSDPGCENKNEFSLSGTVCLFKGRK